MKNCVNLSVKEEIIKYLKQENYTTSNSDDSYYIRFEKYDNNDKEVQKRILVQIYQSRNKKNFLVTLQVKLFSNLGYFKYSKSQDIIVENLVGFQKIVYSVDDIRIFLEKFKMLRFLRKYFDL